MNIIISSTRKMDSNISTLAQTQKFHLKSAKHGISDANLTTAIKKGNVRSFIKKGGGISEETDNQADDLENMGLEGHLLQLKNSCCELNKEIKSKESETFKFRDETLFTLEKGKKLKEERQRLEDKISSLQKSLDQVSSKRDSAFHCSKTYEHILERMKKDSIHNQLKKNELTRELRTLQKGLNIAQTKQYSLAEMERLSSFGVRDAHQEFGQQKRSRKQKLNYIESETSKKREKAEKLRERQQQTEQIQQMAAGDLQDADLLRLKKFLTVQLFLKELLKSKISKLKKYFEPYEIAFYQIKSRTHVKDASSLKTQFFNFQNSYTEKTEWVKVLEAELQQTEEERNQLKEQLKQLSNEEIQILEQLEGKDEVHEPSVNRRELSQKSIRYQLALERINAWLAIQAKKMNMSVDEHCGNPEQLMKALCNKLQADTEKPSEDILGGGSSKKVVGGQEEGLELVQQGMSSEHE